MARFSLEERFRLAQLLALRLSIRELAVRLGRAASSISQEIRRNGMNALSYNPYLANEHAKLRQGASKRNKKIQGALEEIIDLLLIERHFSPEQISGYLKKQYPDNQTLKVSPETIYKHIYSSHKSSFYISSLRRKRKKRGSRGHKKIRKHRIPNLISIENRPTEVKERNVVGHWEGDLIIGKGHKSALGVLVERSLRYTIIVPFVHLKDVVTVAHGFAKALIGLPSHLKSSLTYDQGSEMTSHELFTKLSGIPVYFAHKGSPWERGTNENTNGLIRVLCVY